MFKDIMLCVDMQDQSSMTRAFDTSVELCRNESAILHILSVVPDVGFPVVGQYLENDFEEKIIAEAKKQLSELVQKSVPDDIKVRHIVAQGSIYDQIVSMSRQIGADLIVITAHRPELKDYLLGPNAARVVRHAKCSVLVIR